MKKIIDDKLYDTEKAEKIYSFRQRRKTGVLFDTYDVHSWFEIDVYKTKKSNYFLHGYIKDASDHKEFIEKTKSNYFLHGYIKDASDHKEFIEKTSEKKVKEIIKELNADKYIELFGKIEEA